MWSQLGEGNDPGKKEDKSRDNKTNKGSKPGRDDHPSMWSPGPLPRLCWFVYVVNVNVIKGSIKVIVLRRLSFSLMVTLRARGVRFACPSSAHGVARDKTPFFFALKRLAISTGQSRREWPQLQLVPFLSLLMCATWRAERDGAADTSTEHTQKRFSVSVFVYRGIKQKRCCRNDHGRHRHVVSNFPVSCQQLRYEKTKYSSATVRPICSYLSVFYLSVFTCLLFSDICQWRARIACGASVCKGGRDDPPTHYLSLSFFFCFLTRIFLIKGSF